MPKKGDIRKWDAESMRKAILAVRGENMGILLASKTFCVPFATLQRAARSDRSIDDILNTPLGRKPVFNPDLEMELVKYVKDMESRFWGLTRSDIRSLAFQIAKRNHIDNPFSLIKECAGKDWLYGFLKRHKSEISLRSVTGTSRGKRSAATVLTTSPYKASLEESIRNIEKRKNKPLKSRSGKKRRKPNRESSSSESEESLQLPSSDEDPWIEAPPSNDTVCAFCNKVFEIDEGNPTWLSCLQCDLVWAHNKCLPKRQAIFVCESCKSS